MFLRLLVAVIFYSIIFSSSFIQCQNNETTPTQKVNNCYGISITANFIRGIDEANVLKYKLDLKVTPGSRRGLTQISLINERITTQNASLYRVIGPLQFWDDREDQVFKCVKHFKNCSFEIIDGGGNLELPVSLENEIGSPVILMDVMFDEGTIFQAPYGQLFDGDSKCFETQGAATSIPDFIQDINICCTDFKSLSIPNRNRDQCIEFSSKTSIIIDEITKESAQLNVNYVVEESAIQIKVTNFIAPQGTEFYLQPNENSVTCSFSNFNCTQPILNEADFAFDFEAFVQAPKKLRHSALVGKLSRRKGIYLRNNDPFTIKSPCWRRDQPGFWKSKFCCSKFSNYDSTDKCAEYESRTKLTNDSMELGYFQTRYIFSEKHLNLQILNYTAFKESNGMFNYFWNIFLSQDCSVSTLEPQNNCKLELNLDKSYEFLLKTSFAQDGFVLFKAKEDNEQFIEPKLNPTNPCVTLEYSGLYPVPKMLAKTEVCCIPSLNGPWPGTF